VKYCIFKIKTLEDVLLKPQTMKVRQVQGIENVATAVWFATLLLTYDHCNQMVNFVENDTYLKQATIRNIAEQIINRLHRVDQSRVGEYCNGDHPGGNTLNYLRANGKARRLTAMGEFNWHKEKPIEIGRYDASIFEVLDDNDNPVYQISGGDLRRWYENIYSPLISQNHDL